MVHGHFVGMCVRMLRSLEERQLQTQGQRISICSPFPPLRCVMSVPSAPHTAVNSGNKCPAAVYMLLLWQCSLHTAHWLSHCCSLAIRVAAHCGLALFPAGKKNQSMKVCDLLRLFFWEQWCSVTVAVVQPLVFTKGGYLSKEKRKWRFLALNERNAHL